jgi:hypothetical protein
MLPTPTHIAGQAPSDKRAGIVAAIAGFFVMVNTVYVAIDITDKIPARTITFFLVNLPLSHDIHNLSLKK